jgi:hypothetical protein
MTGVSSTIDTPIAVFGIVNTISSKLDLDGYRVGVLLIKGTGVGFIVGDGVGEHEESPLLNFNVTSIEYVTFAASDHPFITNSFQVPTEYKDASIRPRVALNVPAFVCPPLCQLSGHTVVNEAGGYDKSEPPIAIDLLLASSMIN